MPQGHQKPCKKVSFKERCIDIYTKRPAGSTVEQSSFTTAQGCGYARQHTLTARPLTFHLPQNLEKEQV